MLFRRFLFLVTMTVINFSSHFEQRPSDTSRERTRIKMILICHSSSWQDWIILPTTNLVQGKIKANQRLSNIKLMNRSLKDDCIRLLLLNVLRSHTPLLDAQQYQKPESLSLTTALQDWMVSDDRI